MKKKASPAPPSSTPFVSDASLLPGDDPASGLLKYTSLTAFFHDQLGQVRQNQRFEATEQSEHYVVSLLEVMADADRLYQIDKSGRRLDKALALRLNDAVHGPPGRRIDQYRRLGDIALFIAGMFADSLARSAVGVGYYIDMGKGAYGSLADHMRGQRGRGLRELFEELADTFAGWVEVLREVSESVGLSRPPTEADAGELYERWSRLKGHQAERLGHAMIVRGMLPAWGIKA